MKPKRNVFSGWISAVLILAVGLGLLVVLYGSQSAVRAKSPVATVDPAQSVAATGSLNPIPTLAYYYIWYDSNSWNRAKVDLPLLGSYTSDDRTVMRQQIQWAKAAGIEGFIVSWKSTPVLNRRLDQLIQVAEEENFKLAIIYESLDFYRNPLPVSQVASDLDLFIQQYAGQKPFELFSKPLVIWAGTWEYTPQDVAQVTAGRRDSLLILASERNLAGCQRLAGLVDGEAYYWSSVNPDTFPGYQDKLTQMSAFVHQDGGLWIAPAAPGFDARLIGGTNVVDRKNGDTFRTEINTAMASSPDALGIISWNEFSENSYIEPSQTYGFQYLDILSEINHLPDPAIPSFDSSDSTVTSVETPPASRLIAVGGLTILMVAGIVVISRRRRV